MDKLTQKSTVDAAKGAPVKKQLPQPENDKPFRIGDEVIVFDKNGNPIKGIVRSVKKNMNVLGIEAVSYIFMHKIETISLYNKLMIYHPGAV